MGKICSGINNENFMSCTTAQIFFIFFSLFTAIRSKAVYFCFVCNEHSERFWITIDS